MYKIAILSAAVLFVVLSLYMAATSTHNQAGVDSTDWFQAVTSEREFLGHMIPHYEEAVVAAELVLQKGTSFRPLLELAEDIVVSHTGELEKIRERYQTLDNEPYEVGGEYRPVMRPLTELSGAEFDRTFLEDMILHHETTVATAEAVLKLSISTKTRELITHIIITKEAEVGLMKELISLLPQ